MTKPTRIALIHATRVAITPIEDAGKSLWPEAELVSILEEGLSLDRASNRVPLPEINARIVELARYAERLQPDGILYTCSAFGEGIMQAARSSDLPVHRPNEAMFDAALELGENIAMIYTFPPSLKGMEEEFKQAATEQNPNASIRSVYAEGAMEALRAGDASTHNSLVAEAAKNIDDASAILLAQFSMAQAAPQIRTATHIPVLTSPEAAIQKMQACVLGK